MNLDRDKYYTYPRSFFEDSVGRPFPEKHWADFIQAMDKYALFYMNNLENVLAKEYHV